MSFLLSVVSENAKHSFSVFFDVFKTAFVSFSWTDAVDILILACILFFAFRFFKNRKAGALLIGIAVCGLFLVLATIFALDSVAYLFSAIFHVGAIAIVIIFQPEIREALEKVGSGSLSKLMSFGDHKKRKMVYKNAIDNICTAVNDLSRTRTGALIVIERTTQIDDIVHTGILLNADTSSFLLRNIFYDKAPLHDGAVVIEDGRISAAGCLLPLTRRSDVEASLGTRHRAAIGMSETSDAIIIVVSEETGIISVAFDCTLERNFTSETLRRYLNKKILYENEEDDT